jgi:hypothetical protein
MPMTMTRSLMKINDRKIYIILLKNNDKLLAFDENKRQKYMILLKINNKNSCT